MFKLKRLTPILGLLTTAVISTPSAVNANPNLTPGVWTKITPAAAQINTGGPNYFTQGITIDPSNLSTLYFCVCGYDQNFNALPGSIWKTTDAGSNWTSITQLDQPIHVRVDPSNSSHMYAVDGVRGNTLGFWVTTNGGATWTQPAAWTTMCNNLSNNGEAGFGDSYALDLEPGNGNHVLVSAHGGAPVVGESTDGGTTWTSHVTPATYGSGGFSVFFLYSPNHSVGNAQTWLFCTQGDGMWRTTNSGASWTQVTTTNMNHGGNQIYYTSGGNVIAGAVGGPIRSTDNGATWQASTGAVGGSMGLTGDGTNLYTGCWWQTQPYLTSAETDGLTWAPYSGSPTFTNAGPMEMVSDKTNGIVYSSNTSNGLTQAANSGDGIWALKVGAAGPPAAPAGLTATAGNTQVALAWNASSGATAYDVKRSTVSGSGYVTVSSPTTNSYTNTGLTNGTTYYFVVDAKNASGTSANSSQASATPAASAPPAPTGLAATAGNAQVALNWNASTGATSYNALRSTISGSGYASVATGISTTSYTNTGLTNGTTYYFVVTATNATGTSGNSNQASATPSSSSSVEVDDNSGSITYTGTWNPNNLTGYYLTTLHASLTPNSYATFTFTGTSIQWIGAKNTDHGIANVYIDGTLITTVDGYATSWLYQQVMFSQTGLTNASHTIEILVTGNKDAASSNYFQDIDAFIYGTATGGAPAAPTGLTATPGNAQVALSWTASSGATSYNVLRSTVNGSGYASVATGVSTTAYTNTGLTNGTTYYFVVTATNASGTSGNSNQASATPQVSAPAAPTGLTATPGNTQVALSWTASSGATSYNVLRSTVNGSGYASVATGISTTAYTNTGLTNGTTYYFVVTATNAGGTSGNSNQASATPTTGIPAAPTGLTATPGNAQVALSWTASSGATSYNALRSTVSGSGYASVATSISTTTYTNTGLTNGTTYYFVVTATNASGTSGNSAQASATPNASVEVDDGNAAIVYTGTWNGNAISGYYLTTLHASLTPNSYATFTFTGTSIQWIGAKNNDHGIANVYIDGTLITTMDGYSPTWLFQQTLFSQTGLTRASHTIEIMVTGNKNASSANYFQDIDAFIYTP